jgi:hypothetical protein
MEAPRTGLSHDAYTKASLAGANRMMGERGGATAGQGGAASHPDRCATGSTTGPAKGHSLWAAGGIVVDVQCCPARAGRIWLELDANRATRSRSQGS